MPVRIPVLLAVAAALAAAPPADGREWLAGDGHVHTCYSHDAYCPQTDPPQDAETFYSSFGTVEQRFAEAAAKGLDYLVISDHDDRRAWDDPAFGSQGVVGVKAYEWSLSGGHAQMLGAARDYGDGDPALAAEALNADGGLFQANHPSYRAGEMVTTCDEAAGPDTPLHWKLGFDVRPDAIEVWNATALIPPAELFWECWLQRGVRVPVTAGSDSHGATQPNLGLPTTWVLAEGRSQAAILEGIRLGRTTLSRLPPALGGARLVLEADADGDGAYEATMGDTVAPGAALRVRAEGLFAPALVRVRAGGRTIVSDAPLTPGGTVELAAPEGASWVRAVAYQPQWTAMVDPFCRPPASAESPVDLCTADLAITAMTSPVYAEAAAPEPDPAPSPPAAPSGSGAPAPSGDEPDDDPPLPPAAQSLHGAPLPPVPPQGRPALPRLRLIVRGRAVRWSPRGLRYDVQVRVGRRWRTRLAATAATSLRAGRRVAAVRVRPRAADGRAGRWSVARVGRAGGGPRPAAAARP
ncbi:MAG TPA: CehA/McbA family metallohydrolase [Solirubrobacteraceae bacterium]|jgi:hypothetical protein|nr:CehA/McbA family metallohydrolase [Solirubrobacteraceae bacterium]